MLDWLGLALRQKLQEVNHADVIAASMLFSWSCLRVNLINKAVTNAQRCGTDEQKKSFSLFPCMRVCAQFKSETRIKANVLQIQLTGPPKQRKHKSLSLFKSCFVHSEPRLDRQVSFCFTPPVRLLTATRVQSPFVPSNSTRRYLLSPSGMEILWNVHNKQPPQSSLWHSWHAPRGVSQTGTAPVPVRTSHTSCQPFVTCFLCLEWLPLGACGSTIAGFFCHTHL